MSTNQTHLKKAIYNMFNDIIEQSFRQMIHFPEEGDVLNGIIKDATDELNYLVMKLDSHNFEPNSQSLQKHYNEISRDLNRSSLELLGRLQKIQRQAQAKIS